jgi:hypothetical protein
MKTAENTEEDSGDHEPADERDKKHQTPLLSCGVTCNKLWQYRYCLMIQNIR